MTIIDIIKLIFKLGKMFDISVTPLKFILFSYELKLASENVAHLSYIHCINYS